MLKQVMVAAFEFHPHQGVRISRDLEVCFAAPLVALQTGLRTCAGQASTTGLELRLFLQCRRLTIKWKMPKQRAQQSGTELWARIHNTS